MLIEREIDEVLQSLALRLNIEATQILSQPFSANEITETISSMSRFKSLARTVTRLYFIKSTGILLALT